ncbi:MAG: alpha/beta fold hydrolase [Nocardioidaceae bacterium]
MTAVPDETSARIGSFARDGLVFDVVDSGPLDGPAVVMLHGFPERATHWAGVSARLHRQGLRTLAPDQRGYSPGARPRGRAAYRMTHLVADAVGLVERYGAAVHLVGHDWGAAVAWQLASRRPDLVRTLTTVSVPHPGAFAASLLTSSQALRSWYVLAIQPPGLVELLARTRPGVLRAMLRRAGLRDDEVDRFWAEIVDDGALPGALAWYRALPLSWSRPPGPVRASTTHVWSDGDAALSRRGALATGEFVEAPFELRVLEGVDHWVPTHAPDLLADAIIARIDASDPRATS